jgi:hypothetical protein
MRQSAKCAEHFACICYRDEIVRLEAELKELRARLRAAQSGTASNLSRWSVENAGTKNRARPTK